jgi:ubiquitin-conjugating enzyme E2 G1
MNTVARLLQKQLREVQHNSNAGFSAGLVDENIFKWRITLLGPTHTPY